MPEQMLNVSWDELLSKLTQSSNQKCSIRLLDTCFINGKVSGKRAQWYYTTKNGSIAKKKKEKTKAEDIVTRFGRFALANPNNTDQYVGNLVKPNGQRIYITVSELEEFLHDTKSFECFGIDYKTFLQVYLRPQNGVDQVAVASFSEGVTKCFMKENDSVELTDIGVIENSKFIMNQMSIFTDEIVSFLKGESFRVNSMSTEFVIDDNGHIWLSRVSQLSMSPLIAEEEKSDRYPEEETDESPDLTESTLSQARKNPTPASASELLPDLPPRTTSSQGRVKNPDLIHSPGKLLRKEGGIYKSILGPDDLPGLRAWVLTSISQGASSDENKWAIDMKEYSKRASIDKDFAFLRDSRASMRRSASSLMVSFIIKAEGLITGEVNVTNEENLKKLWKAVYEDALVSDSFKSSGDVKICGNCEAIVAKLQSLISVDFKAGVLPGHKHDVDDDKDVITDAPEDNVETRSPTAAVPVSSKLSSTKLDSNPRSKDKPIVDSAAHKKASKPKKSGRAHQGKRSKEDQGPSMDMLAKFAAERDRQHQLLAEQERMMGIEVESSADELTSKGAKKDSKKNSKVKDSHTPSVKNSLEENEKRLAELERMASDNASRYMQPEIKFVAPGSAISQSEESFLMRQSAQGDVSHLSALRDNENLENDASVAVSNVVANLEHERDKKVIVQLKDKLTEKETLITQLQTSLKNKDKEFNILEKRNNELNKRFSEFRNNADEEKDDKITDLESEILKLKDEYSRNMAKYTMQDAAAHQTALKQVSQGESSQGTTALIVQMDSLRAELRAMAEKSVADRKAVQTEASIKYLSSEKKHNAEVSQLRHTITTLEDTCSRLEEELDSEKRKTNGLTEISRNLEASRLEAVNVQNKLRNDLKSMQQTMASTYKMESSQNIGMGVDAESAIKLAEAKSEAKVRQLTNQVEFLKSQLAAELSSVEEMKHVMESARDKADAAKADYRMRMAEAEKRRVRDVEEMEQITEQKYELRMNELSSLQAKFLSMQNQVQESIQDSEAARQREEMSKNSAAKYQGQIAMLRQEVEKLNEQVIDLREKNDNQSGTSNDVNKHSHESMMRRLDNERQYLKSQLASEITLKNELQKSLASCQAQLNDVQRQWTEDVDQLRGEATQLEQETLRNEQSLNQIVSALRADNERGRSQLEDMKNGFVKMRDELRAEQTALENSRAVKQRLMDELETARGELKLMKEEEERTNAITKQQIAAVTLSTNELVASKNKTITGLQESLARQFAENSEAQKQSILCKDELRQERVLSGRKIESIKIYTALKNWKRVRLNSFFQQWQKNAMLCTAAAQFREKMKQVVKKKVDAAIQEQQKEKQKAITDTEFEWHEKMEKALIEKDDEITDITDEHDKALDAERERAAQELEVKLAELNAANDVKLQNIQLAHQSELKLMDEKRKQLVQDQRATFKDELAKHAGMLEQKAYQEKLAAVSAKETELVEKFNAAHVDLEDDYDDKIRDLKNKHVAEVAELHYQAEREKQTEVMNLTKEHEASIEALKLQHAETIQDLLHQKALEMEAAEKELETKHREHASVVKQRTNEQGEERLREMRQLWETEFQEKMAEKDQHFEAQLEMEVEKANSAAVELKNKCVKLETTKWQQVLREAEKRFAMEVQKAHQKGFGECEQKMKDEMFNSTEACKRDILLAQEKGKHALETIKNDFAEKMENLNNAHAVAIRTTIESTEKSVRAELADHMKEYVEKMVTDGKAEVTSIYEKKLEAEMIKLAKANDDITKVSAASSAKVLQLQSQIDMLEMRLKHGEISSFDQITKLENDLETQRATTERREKTLLEDTKAKLAEKHEENLMKLTADMEAEALRRIEAEKSRMADHLDEQMNELQDENERLIGGLESALADLKKQKTEVTNELESTTTKLETAEDSLYDAQQALSMLQKKHSISSWRFASRLMNMNVIFKRELNRARTDASTELARCEQEGKTKLEDFILLGMNLASVILKVQEAREKVHSTLTTYKSDVLIEKRTHIKLLEKEINRLADEKELMDEQRDNLEEELVQYEKEIESIEVEIREHTRSSSVMQNGRINVAHARKKKRFDTELERILDLIEQKRSQINDMDARCQGILTQKDEKEADLTDMEKDLVLILIEQQRLVLSQIEEAQAVEDKGKTLLKLSPIAWPPILNPTKEDVSACHRRANKRYREKAGIEDEDQ